MSGNMVEEFNSRLWPLRDQLSLNLAMADLENKDTDLLDNILQSLVSLKKLWDEKDLQLFARAASTLHRIVSIMVVDQVEYPIALSTVLKLYKTLDEGVERFLYDGTVQESFEEDFKAIEGRLPPYA